MCDMKYRDVRLCCTVAEAEHGYASTMPIPDDIRTVVKRTKTKKSQGSRFVHYKLTPQYLNASHIASALSFYYYCYSNGLSTRLLYVLVYFSPYPRTCDLLTHVRRY